MIKTHVLGFPAGSHELDAARERHRRGEIDEPALEQIAAQLRMRHWMAQRNAGLDFITVGDVPLRERVASQIQLFGCEPRRFTGTSSASGTQRHLAMTEGAQALSSAPWFASRLAHCVPEFDATTQFRLSAQRLLIEIAVARSIERPIKVALIGPLTFLWLGRDEYSPFDPLELLDALLPVYVELLALLKTHGVDCVQLDEPILGLNLPPLWSTSFERTYHRLNSARMPILLATYLMPLESQLIAACKLPVMGLHIDTIASSRVLQTTLDWIGIDMTLSIGLVDGSTIARCDFPALVTQLRKAAKRRPGKIWIAPSCSLAHLSAGDSVPACDPLYFAREKIDELAQLRQLAMNDTS